MDEYVGLDQSHPQSYHHFMFENFFNHIDIIHSNIHILNGTSENLQQECINFEHNIQQHGGIDLMLGGIGTDGHIAFNEPGSSLDSVTRIKTLNDETIEISEDQKLYDKQFKIEFIGSKNKIEDKYKFEDVIKLLLENKNDKENSNVSIEIFYDENSIELELPLSINYSEDLKSRLDLIIGNHNIIIT